MKKTKTTASDEIQLTPQEKLRIVSRLQVKLRELVAKRKALLSKKN